MLDDREYMIDRRPRFQWSMTMVILVANVLVFILQYLAERFAPEFPYEGLFALSLQGLRHGFIWQLLTYQFLHAGFWHIFLNSWAIYVFGRPVENAMGKTRMAVLYFLSGIAGGMLQMFCAWLMPEHFGIEEVVGASAGAYGLVAATAAIFPNQVLYLLVYFVIPVKMRTKTLLWVSIAMSVVGIIIPYGNIGHSAHLGGIITGFLIARHWLRGYRVPPVIVSNPKTSLKVNTAPD